MNEIMKQSQQLMTQLNSIYNQPSYLSIKSAMSNLITPMVINNNMSNYIGNAIKTIIGYRTAAIFANNMTSELVKSIKNQMPTFDTTVLSSAMKSIGGMASWKKDFSKKFSEFYNRILFMDIADEIGFPIYMEVDTELQNQLLKSYRKNGNQCNKEEMRQIIIDYYNDGYVDQILNGIQNVGIFNEQRVKLISEGIEVYQLGYYGASAASFASYISGMIRDIYKEICTLHKFTKEEKKEIIACFDQRCKPDSEKGMLLQIVCSQDRSPLFWYQVVSYFLDNFYASGENGMELYPKRHMLCHGIQLNHDTKEMNLILIMCMDILSELACRVKKMKEENTQIVIDL